MGSSEDDADSDGVGGGVMVLEPEEDSELLKSRDSELLMEADKEDERDSSAVRESVRERLSERDALRLRRSVTDSEAENERDNGLVSVGSLSDAVSLTDVDPEGVEVFTLRLTDCCCDRLALELSEALADRSGVSTLVGERVGRTVLDSDALALTLSLNDWLLYREAVSTVRLYVTSSLCVSVEETLSDTVDVRSGVRVIV